MDQNVFTFVAESVVAMVRQKIIENSYHRWELKKYEAIYAAPNPSIWTLRVLLQNLLFAGADKLNMTNFQYDPQTSVIRIEICLPLLLFKSGKSAILAKLCDKDFDSKLSGQIAIKNLRLFCKTVIIMNDGGIKTENWDIKVSVESIKYDIHFTVLGMDFSETFNNWLSVKLVEFINSLGDTLTEKLGPMLTNLAQMQRNKEIMNMF